jgi:hypothetical protein
MPRFMSSARFAAVSGFAVNGRTSIRETSVEVSSLSVKTEATMPSGDLIGPRSWFLPGFSGLVIEENDSLMVSSIAFGSMSPTTTNVIRRGV